MKLRSNGRSHLPSMTHHAMFHENCVENDVEWTRKADMSKSKFPAAGEARRTLLWTLDNLDFSFSLVIWFYPCIALKWPSVDWLLIIKNQSICILASGGFQFCVRRPHAVTNSTSATDRKDRHSRKTIRSLSHRNSFYSQKIWSGPWFLTNSILRSHPRSDSVSQPRSQFRHCHLSECSSSGGPGQPRPSTRHRVLFMFVDWKAANKISPSRFVSPPFVTRQRMCRHLWCGAGMAD